MMAIFKKHGYKIKSPGIKRKLEILRNKIIEAKISESPELQHRQNEIKQKMIDYFGKKKITFAQRIRTLKESDDRQTRKNSLALLAPFLDKQENNFREILKLANKLAKKEGFKDFCSAKAIIEETSLAEIKKTLSHAKKTTNRPWKNILTKIRKITGVKNLEQFDLYYGINKLVSNADSLTKAAFFSSLNQTIKKMGFDLNNLPIKIAEVINAPPAAVYALGLSKNSSKRKITIAIDAEAGWRSYAFLFHEFGHAIYYVFSPSSFLLTDPHLSREMMAEMWVGFIEQPSWLILNGFAKTEKIAREIIKAKSIWDIFQLRTQILEAEFELSIHSDPDCDFKKVWRKLSLDILGVDDSLGVYSEFVFIHPFDIKDYILAWNAKKIFVNFCKKKYGNDFVHSKVVDFLIKKFYSPGASIRWNQKLSFLKNP